MTTLDPITRARRQDRLRDGQPRDWAHRRAMLKALLMSWLNPIGYVKVLIKQARKDLANKEEPDEQ